ncbi:DNA polymerase I [subsurface metagenome]
MIHPLSSSFPLFDIPLVFAKRCGYIVFMAKTLYIIDGHAHIYAAYFARMRPLTSPAGEPTQATYIFTIVLLGLIRDRKPDMLAVAMDSKVPTFRTEIYAEYKAHRPPMPGDMPQQIDRIEQILEAMNVPVLRLEGFEADDVIGTLAKKAAKNKIDTYICSKDKDMLQLLDKYIFTFDIKSGQVTDTKSMKDLQLTPEQFLEALALQGDKSDNVPGIADVGPKTALEWIQKFGSIENLYKHADEITGKRGDNLRASRKLVDLSKTLVTIDTNAPLKIKLDELKLTEPDSDKLAAIFTELGFSRLLTQLGLSPVKLPKTAEKPSVKAEQKPDEKISRGDSVKTVEHNYQLINSTKKFEKFFKELKKQKLFAIDTETNSIEPVRADLVGISICFEPNEAYYIPVKAPLGQKVLDINYVREKLAPVLADEKIKKIGQNIKFDYIVLHNARMSLKGIYFDTMVASYCLEPTRKSHSMDAMALDFLDYDTIKLAFLIGKGKNQLTFDMVDLEPACEYAAEDADITFRLYQYLKVRLESNPPLRKLFEEVEMPLVAVLAQMELNGVSLDVPLLKKLSTHISESLKRTADAVYKYAGSVFNIDSPKQLAEVLFDKLGLQSIKVGKAGRSTDAFVLEQLSDRHKIIPLILEYRQLSKLQNTYVDKLGSLINHKTNRVHASFNQTITATGRLSSSKPNLQNIPIRTELGRKIRAAFVPAKKTDCILSADYSQIELRFLAHFSKDETLIKAFEENRDIHRFVASQIYDCPIDKVTDDMRSKCKAVNFGIIYGQSPYGLSQTVGISQADAKKFIDDYFSRYSSIRNFIESVKQNARKTGFAETILHRIRRLNDIKNKNANKRNQAERMAINTVIQGSAADLIKVAMINIQHKIDSGNLPVKMILQIHDELVFELPAKQAEKHAEWIDREMTSAINLDVPLKVDITHGPNWLK